MMCYLDITRFMCLLMMLFVAGCTVKRVGDEVPRAAFTSKTVALMTAPTAEAAESLRQSLLRGQSLPLTTEIIPISQLDRISTVLTKVAAGLVNCEVSQPIPPENTTGNAYIVLQKGGDTEDSCQQVGWSSLGFFQEIDEKVGELFMGLLVVGLTGLLIALPFILHH